jgi:hypothetical protein
MEVGYRGAFTLDGVATTEGFRPTELNPRNGAGLVTMARAIGFPIQLLLDALVAGLPLEWRPGALEELLVDGADVHRSGGTWRSIEASLPAVEPRPIVYDPEAAWRWADDGEAPGAVTQVGEAGDGASFVRVAFDPDATPAGPAVAARAVAFWAFADHELGTTVGPLVPSAEAAHP